MLIWYSLRLTSLNASSMSSRPWLVCKYLILLPSFLLVPIKLTPLQLDNRYQCIEDIDCHPMSSKIVFFVHKFNPRRCWFAVHANIVSHCILLQDIDTCLPTLWDSEGLLDAFLNSIFPCSLWVGQQNYIHTPCWHPQCRQRSWSLSTAQGFNNILIPVEGTMELSWLFYLLHNSSNGSLVLVRQNGYLQWIDTRMNFFTNLQNLDQFFVSSSPNSRPNARGDMFPLAVVTYTKISVCV